MAWKKIEKKKNNSACYALARAMKRNNPGFSDLRS